MKRRGITLEHICIILICMIIAIDSYHAVAKIYPRRNYVGTVTDKTITKRDGEDVYVVFTQNSDGEIYPLEVVDSLLSWRFNSADLYDQIQVGETYEFEIAGSRNYLFNWYPNICIAKRRT